MVSPDFIGIVFNFYFQMQFGIRKIGSETCLHNGWLPQRVSNENLNSFLSKTAPLNVFSHAVKFGFPTSGRISRNPSHISTYKNNLIFILENTVKRTESS